MIFTRLLWRFLLPGEYTAQEREAAVRLEPAANESVLLFDIDDNGHGSLYGTTEDGNTPKCCDFMYLYSQRYCNGPLMVFVELKSAEPGASGTHGVGTVEWAKDQIKEAMLFVSSQIGDIEEVQMRRKRRAAVIVLKGRLPDDFDEKAFMKRARAELGASIFIRRTETAEPISIRDVAECCARPRPPAATTPVPAEAAA